MANGATGGGEGWEGGDGGDGLAGSAGEALVMNGNTLMRVQHDAMLAVSVQRKRKEREVLKAALDEIDMVPHLAARNYYSIPYKDRDEDGREKTTYVTGPSIQAARSLMRRWGNASAQAIVVGEDEQRIMLAGVFVDLETNVRFERPFVVSKYRWDRRARKTVSLRDDRLMMAIQAGASKAERNAIVAGLPDWLVRSYFDKARKVAADRAREHVGKMLESFLALGVTREVIEKHMGKPVEKLGDEELADLRGVYNALGDREVSIEAAFPRAFESDEKAEPGAGSVDDVLAGGATVKGAAAPGQPAPSGDDTAGSAGTGPGATPAAATPAAPPAAAPRAKSALGF